MNQINESIREPEEGDRNLCRKIEQMLEQAIDALRSNPLTQLALAHDKGSIHQVISQILKKSDAFQALVAKNSKFQDDDYEYHKKYGKDLIDANYFSKLDIASKGGIFLASFRLMEYRRIGAEIYAAADLVLYLEGDEIKSAMLLRKAIVSGGMYKGGLERTTSRHAERLQLLEKQGIPVIHINGVFPERAEIAERLYCDTKNEILNRIKTDLDTNIPYLRQLVEMAYKLDKNGWNTLKFLDDIIFDPEDKCFRYVDAGSDLGEPEQKDADKKPALLALQQEFPEHQEKIAKMYNDMSRNQKMRSKTRKEVHDILGIGGI